MVRSFLGVPLCPSRGARKESIFWCFSSSAAEGRRQSWNCTLSQTNGLLCPHVCCRRSEFWLKANHSVVLPFLPRLLSLQSRQASRFSFPFLQQSPVLPVQSRQTPLNIWVLMTEPIFHATLTTEVIFWSCEMAPCILKSAEWMFVGSIGSCLAVLTLPDTTVSFINLFLHTLRL